MTLHIVYSNSIFIKYFSSTPIIALDHNITHFGSTLAVASSISRIGLHCRMALARHTSCLCPMLRSAPPSLTTKSRPPGWSATILCSCVCKAIIALCNIWIKQLTTLASRTVLWRENFNSVLSQCCATML